ncbi:MAG: acyl carrier protein [Actinomycetota bacterium]
MGGQESEILAAIKEHLGGRGLEVDKIEPGAELLGDLDLDSLDTVELSLGLEERFGIEIPDEDLEGLVTVQDAVRLIESKLAAAV